MRKPKFLGVYSLAAVQRKKGARKRLFFVWEIDKAIAAIQELNEAFVPIARPESLPLARLRTQYSLEPSILAAPVTTPDFRQLAPAAKKAEAAELNDATLLMLEKARRTKQVENDLRGSFSKALRALNRPRDRKGALAALEQLAETRDGIVPAHRHMFRDFGVSLRKKSLPELSLRCAMRALELSPNDDHAHFNVARALSILGLYDEADAHLRQAVQLDGTEEIYPRMQAYIRSLRGSKP